MLVSTLTFIAPVNAIRYAGAWPVFVDAEPTYWQMDPDRVLEFIEHQCEWINDELRNRHTGRRVSAIIPVHILGHPVDMEPILTISRKYGLKVIEDSTEALGSMYRGKSPGSWGDIGCFSFNGNKIITTGGGGMIVTDREDWAKKAKYLTTQAKDDPIEYIHGVIGFNYRLTNVLAAIGCAQMEQLVSYVAKKRSIATRYQRGLADTPGLTLMKNASWAECTYWMYTILVPADPTNSGIDSRQLLRILESQKIQSRPLWQPIHLSPAHAVKGAESLPVAEHLADHALSLPCSVNLSDHDQDRVIEAPPLPPAAGTTSLEAIGANERTCLQHKLKSTLLHACEGFHFQQDRSRAGLSSRWVARRRHFVRANISASNRADGWRELRGTKTCS